MDTLFKFITKIYSPKYFPIFATTMLVLFTTLSLNGLLSEKVITIEQEGITLRVGAATNSSAVITLSEGDRVEIMGERNGWYNVRVNGNQTGYIPSWLLSNSQLTSDQSLAAHLTEPLVLRQNATEDSKEVARIPADEYVHVNFENNGWLQVEYGEQYGYIQTKDVELLSKANIPNPSRENLAENNSYSDESLVEDSDTEIVYVRQGNQAFLQSPDYASDIFYHPSYNQEFLYISEHNVDDEYSFYYVEDDEGTRGYIDKRYAALKSDYAGHVDTTDAKSIAEATIIIDAGHGGMDPGTMSLDEQYLEKDYTLPTALYLQQELEALGATVIMTRISDEFVYLDDITQLSNQSNADAFISIHFDASHDPDWSGSTTYYFHEPDFRLAEAVNNELTQLPLRNHYVVFGNFHVLRENNRPSLLLELGFMTNVNDLEFLTLSENQQQYAKLIAQGLVNYFNNQ